ncbi:MAG: zinc-binding dehydrogenase [Acidobacteriota bacterium]|nr:MAG: zinc-binding dehydrogenase [Acidobacteriota bacterium]
MSQTMTGVVQYDLTPHSVELREMEIPEIGEEDVLLQVGAVSVCGSDVHQYHGTQSWPVRTPVVLGHEFGGIVARTGSRVRGFREGDRVVSETAASICGRCMYCRSGEYNLCPERKGFGYGINGAMSNYVKVPERCLHHIPDSLPFERAALTEPCCVAYNCVAVKSRIRPGDTVVVFGPGPIGLLCAEMARLDGAGTLIIAGLPQDASRLEAAKQLGVTHAVDLTETNLNDLIRGIGDGLGAHLIIDAAGASAALKSAMEIVRPAGQITKVGWGPQPLNFSIDPLVQKAVTLQGSFSHTFQNWEQVVSMLASGQINLEPVISRIGGLDDWKDCFDGMHDGNYVKSVIRPN